MNSSFSRQVMPKVDVVLVAKCPGWVSTNRTSSQHTPPKKKNGWNMLEPDFWPLGKGQTSTNHHVFGLHRSGASTKTTEKSTELEIFQV